MGVYKIIRRSDNNCFSGAGKKTENTRLQLNAQRRIVAIRIREEMNLFV